MTDIGSVLGGRYRLVELLGQGGMATIYRARDAQLDRDVAVKLIRKEFGQDPDFLSRFRDEARAAASLNHPNIVSVFDFGEDADGPYLVMELIDGQDLTSILRENGALPPRQAARVSAEVAKALQAAHVRGIVHRDIKPSNILVGRDGRVKVADFGIARALTEAQVTVPGVTMGSVHYFSPEQARGESATPASDIYALGIVLYESLTGQRPFTGDGAAAVALARLTSTPTWPSVLRPGIAPELDAVVQRSMALDPQQRYASAAAMGSALEGWLSDPATPVTGATGAAAAGVVAGAAATGAARTVASAQAKPPVPYPPDAYAGGPPAPVSTHGAPPPPPTGDDDEEPEDSSRWAWIAGLIGLLILLVVGFLVFQMLTGGRAEPTPSPSVSPSGSAATVELPSFVDLTFDEAQEQADLLGVVLVIAGTEETTEVEEGVILSQDPPDGTVVPEGSEVQVIVARGPTAVVVPDLRTKPEAEVGRLLSDADLTVGTRTTAFDPTIPAGSVVSQNPGPGIVVAPGTAVDYVVSNGPEPTPEPTPVPTPVPTAVPTPTPTPVPTATVTPEAEVGDYLCQTIEVATTLIDSDGFALGDVTSVPAGTEDVPTTWVVIDQAPNPNASRPLGTAIDLDAAEPGSDEAIEFCP